MTFFGGHRVAPEKVVAGFEPVQFRKDNNDLLVHALVGETVVARLPIDTGGLQVLALEVQVMHKGNDQAGIKVAVWADRRALSARAIHRQQAGFKSDWNTLEPKEKKSIKVKLDQPVPELFAYVAVQLPDGADQARAWSVVTGLKILTR